MQVHTIWFGNHHLDGPMKIISTSLGRKQGNKLIINDLGILNPKLRWTTKQKLFYVNFFDVRCSL